jgi:integrase
MPVLKLTIQSVRNALPLDGKETIYRDTEIKGFSLKVTSLNSKVFFYQYSMGGRAGVTRRINIGKFPTVKPEEARKIANQYAVEVAQKRDPFDRIKEETNTKLKNRENSFGQLLELYDAKQLSQNRSGKVIKRMFEREFLPSLRNTPVSSISRNNISKVTNRIHERGAGYAANEALGHVKTFFRWIVSEGYLQGDPTSVMQKPFKGEVDRTRVLNTKELKFLWQEFNALNCQPIADTLKLLLLLGQRRNEVARMQWKDLDLETGTWSLPREATKNKQPHIVPLSDLVLKIIKGQKRQTIEDKKTGKKIPCPFVFSTTGKTPVSGWSKAKNTINESLAEKEIVLEDWRLHDLRRTVSTNLGDMGYHNEDIGMLLNHTSRGITAVYNRSTYLVKKKEMLKAWQDKLASIIA